MHVLKPAQLAKDRDLFQRTIRAPRVGSYTGLISDLFGAGKYAFSAADAKHPSDVGKLKPEIYNLIQDRITPTVAMLKDVLVQAGIRVPTKSTKQPDLTKADLQDWIGVRDGHLFRCFRLYAPLCLWCTDRS